ncbi:transposase family protein [Streptomyces sp. NPDC096030]|uniref:transposase family protein n=1 Tax=Streptomyces sp. NPDC096030 TaxID=3155423 RepID=UPI00332822D5
MRQDLARTALPHRVCTGIPRNQPGKTAAGLAGGRTAREDARLRERRGHERLRAGDTGRDHQLVFTGRVTVTLVILRFQLPHAAPALSCGAGRSAVTRAVREIRPLLAARGFAVPGGAGLRLRTLAGVFACTAAKGAELRLDGTEVRLRRPEANRPGRRASVPGRMRQNTGKATAVTGGKGRTGWTGTIRPGRMHDQTAAKSEGTENLPERYPQADAGYRGLARRFPGQVQAPPDKPGKDAPAGERAARETARTQQPSGRNCAGHRQRRPLQRYTGRREHHDKTHLAIARLLSGRTAQR